MCADYGVSALLLALLLISSYTPGTSVPQSSVTSLQPPLPPGNGHGELSYSLRVLVAPLLSSPLLPHAGHSKVLTSQCCRGPETYAHEQPTCQAYSPELVTQELHFLVCCLSVHSRDLLLMPWSASGLQHYSWPQASWQSWGSFVKGVELGLVLGGGVNRRLAQRTGCLDCCFLFPAWGRVGEVTGGISEPVLCIGAALCSRSGMGSCVLQCPGAGSCKPCSSQARLNDLLAVRVSGPLLVANVQAEPQHVWPQSNIVRGCALRIQQLSLR